MKRSEMIDGLMDGILDHKLDPREDLFLYIQEAIIELEGTRSIEEVGNRIIQFKCDAGAYGYPENIDNYIAEDKWFLKEDD